MTERKPGGTSYETWVEKQIREAQERGDFDNLRGAGKPIPGRGQLDDELWWLKQYMAREKLDFAMPVPLRLRKQIEDIDDRVARERREIDVRRVVDDLNDRIRTEIRHPSAGPALNRRTLDVDEVVERWSERRRARQSAAVAAAAAPSTDGAEPVAGRRRWWRRRNR